VRQESFGRGGWCTCMCRACQNVHYSAHKNVSEPMRMRARVSLAVVVVAAFLSGVLFTTVGANVLQIEDIVGTPSHAGTTEVSPGPAAVQLQEAFTSVARSVNPTVVQIRSQRVMTRQQM